MKTCYVVTYDVADPRRLRQVHTTLRGFGQHIQLSVFRCELGERHYMALRERLEKIIDPKMDQVLFIRLGTVRASEDERISPLGRPLPTLPKAIIV